MKMTATKFWAALFLVAANAIRSRYGIDFGLDPSLANDLAGGLVAAAVWAIPNKVKADA